MSSASSSSDGSSSEEEIKKRKKEKKSKKDKKSKKHKKEKKKKKKKDKKSKKKKKKGGDSSSSDDDGPWWADAMFEDGKRLLVDMAEMDGDCFDGVANIMKQLDKNDTVDINGIPDARFKKKMRHLLQTVGAEKKGDVWHKPSKLGGKSFKDFFGAIKKPAKKEVKSRRKSPSPSPARQKSPSPIRQPQVIEEIVDDDAESASAEPVAKRARTKG